MFYFLCLFGVSFLKTKAVNMPQPPSNFEEQALQFIGKELYDAFFYGYTFKQWGCHPAELPASILKRLPVRFDYNDNYYSNAFSGIPVEGYTEIIRKMIDHPLIKVYLERKWSSAIDHSAFDHVFYTGPIDGFFDYALGRLGYRTISFEKEYADGDFQGAAQINYCDAEIPFTRITEHKHFSFWEKNERTVYFKEFSKETGPGDSPFYPKRLNEDKLLLKKYRERALTQNKISFLGRLATYRYMDMQHVIEEALIFANKFTVEILNNQPLSVFSNNELY
jgi:UDP-galactopyranose mutase